MGRMLEALKNKDANRAAAKERPFFDDTIEAGVETDLVATVADNSIPFIEIGPNRKMEGSEQVMASRQPAQKTEAQRTEDGGRRTEDGGRRTEGQKTDAEKGRKESTIPQYSSPFLPFSPSPLPSAAAAGSQPLTVAFEPWPALPRIGQGVSTDVIAYHHPEHPVSRQYAALMAKVQDGLSDARAKVALLVGCRPQVGASTVLLNLAVSATQQNWGRIVVVDSQLRRPSLASRMGYVCSTGIQEVFQGRLALEAAVVQTAVTGLHLVPAQPISATPAPRVEAVRWLFSYLSDHFNLVLADAPSLESGSDLAPWLAACDCAYLVVPDDESEPSQRALAQSLTAMGGKLRGLFHTRCR